jgi:GAF domain-containing protein
VTEPQSGAHPSREADSTIDPLMAVAELSRIKLSELDLNQVLTRVAELARRAIPGAAEVSVTLVRGGVAETAAYTGEVALALDEKQYDTGYGPCLDAARDKTVHLIHDMAAEKRWPRWTVNAVTQGVTGSLSVGMPVEDAVSGALNIYAVEPGALDEDDIALARTFAGYAAVALANANLYTTTAKLASQMAEAMESRAVIEQAKGILIAQQRVTADEAFDILIRASQSSNRKVREIAEALVNKAQSGGS